MAHTIGNWKVGKLSSTVISDTIPEDYKSGSGHDSTEYYGGFLIAESVGLKDVRLIAAAPELLEVLKEAKEVLLQLDHRHTGKCYNPAQTDCECTLCKINAIVLKINS